MCSDAEKKKDEEKMLKEAEEFSNSEKKTIIKEGGEEMADGSGMIKYSTPQKETERENDERHEA
jgi:hypothetical protein